MKETLPKPNWIVSRSEALIKFFGRSGWLGFYRQTPILLLAVLIGVLGGYGAVLFRFIIKSTQFLFYGNSDDYLTFASSIPWYLTVGIPCLGGLIVGIIVYFGAREAKGHGVPEVMEAVALKDGIIRKRVAAVKILASAICISSGGSVGREGPIVQIGASIGSTVSQIFRVPRGFRKTLVGCGAAAGIAATFNAPIAGVLFALEILLGDFGVAAFSPVVISSVMATTISRQYFGDFPAFIIPEHGLESLWEFAIYPFLGIFAGLVALAFIWVLYKFEDLGDAIKPIPEYLRPAIGGLILGLILLKYPYVFGVGYGGINMVLVDQMPAMLMLTLLGLKIVSTSITIGSGGSGGIFAPSLFIGAMAGGFFGWCVVQLFPGITANPGTYALVAMGAVVAGTTHAPITAILIIFELTGDYKIILPLMMCCIISTLTALAFNKGSIYTIKLSRRGVDLIGGLEQNVLLSLRVEDYMQNQVAIVEESATLDQIIDTFKTENASYLHMVDKDKHLIGIISFRDIRPILDEGLPPTLIIARDVATIKVKTITLSDNIRNALQIMSSTGFSQLPVVADDDHRTLKGCLREKDVIAAYDNEVLQREITDN